MTEFPIANEIETSYSDLVWNAAKGKYKYIETITYYCSEEAVTDYETAQLNHKTAMEALNKDTIIAGIQEEIDWITSAKASR